MRKLDYIKQPPASSCYAVLVKIFCSGIGGIGLSAYAAHMRSEGHEVHGSDKSDSALLEDLRSQGIVISLNQDGSALDASFDLFVYSEAISDSHPERSKAASLNIRSISYFAALGEISKGKKVIAICGTHGKSSTTAMVARIAIDAGLDPSVVVGTKVRELDGRNWRKGKSDIFILEACEYRKSFHFLSPSIALVTNVDGDHFDAFENVEAYRKAFADFFALLPSDGVIVAHGNDPASRALAEGAERTWLDADAYSEPELSIPGLHMRKNAQLALTLALHLGIPESNARASLKQFQGTWRRMEEIGKTVHDVPVIDDYAHHPVELKATLSGMREKFPTKRIVAVFQPHTHHRTKSLYEEFLSVWDDADVIFIPDIYIARDDHERVDVHSFIADIHKSTGKLVSGGDGLEKTQEMLTTFLQPNDVLVVMGAGDITKLAHNMVRPSRNVGM